MARSNRTVTHVVRGGQDREVWTCKTRNGGTANAPVEVFKHTVRVAKGEPGGGRFQAATNLRGTVLLP